ncbi:GFA family protein [Asticcacaulis sp. DW145]|uniref:GFA family protein n=1 Tax=Asticcacaulis sp. DW145 TaxID=3095608 RepID=UPI003090F8C7|nr:GFA family protein [Asticcacaulis sp. DW145]
MQTVNVPPFPLSGGCQCGRIRYRLKAMPVVFYLCHCTHCQKQSSSAYGESIRVRAADIEIEGQPKGFHVQAESGAQKVCEFCPDCGTRLFHGRRPEGETFNIKGGTLDDAAWLRPAGHIWTRSRQAFVTIGADELSFDKGPATYQPLIERWRQMTGQT